MPQPDVEVLVEALAEKLDRGLSLEDLDGVLVSYSSNQGQADQVRVNFLLSKRVAPEVIAWQLSHGIAQAVRPVPVPSNPELGMWGRVCVPLLVRGFRVGYLWVQQGEFEQDASEILQGLNAARQDTDEIATRLLESNTAESKVRHEKELSFLAAAAGEKSALATVANWPQTYGNGPWQAVTVLDEHAEADPADPPAAVLAHRNAALQATVGMDDALFSAGRAGHSLLLFRALQGRAMHAQVMVHYRLELAKRSVAPVGRIILGLSEPFEDFRQLPQAYAQSRTAALAGVVEPALGELINSRDTGIYQFFANAAHGSADWAGDSSVNFAALLAGDPDHELRQVLEVLYDTGDTVQAVADQLHLHRSTVYNRLGKVRRIIGADPLNGAVRLELHAALKAARWNRRPRLN